MAYASSLARKDFLRGIIQIIIVCKNSKELPSQITDMLFQAAIFKTSALLEEYIHNVISDWLKNAERCGKTTDSLPPNLRWYCVAKSQVDAYKNYLYNLDEQKLINSLIGKKNNDFLSDGLPLAGLININQIVDDKKYPSVKNLNKLFNRLGIQNIFHKVNELSGRSFERNLQSFLDIRTAIAHQSPPPLTIRDITAHIHNIRRFVSALDKVLYDHVVEHHSTCCWRTI